jgi:hypothetical protein
MVHEITSTSGTIRYIDVTAPVGTELTYTICAVNARGEGPRSKPVSAAAIDPASIEILPVSETYVNDTLPDSLRKWYRIATTANRTYALSLNDRFQGDSSKTADVYITLYQRTGESFFERQDSAWTTPKTFAGNGETYYLLVDASYSKGTYGLRLQEE